MENLGTVLDSAENVPPVSFDILQCDDAPVLAGPQCSMIVPHCYIQAAYSTKMVQVGRRTHR